MKAVQTALIHPSYAVRRGVESNQALETIGDGILDGIVASWLYDNGISTEKEITNIRSLIVSNENLAKIGERIGLEKYLKVFKHRITPEDVADCLEAVIGALSRELGYNYTRELLEDLFESEVFKAIKQEKRNPNKVGRSEINPINVLQEYAQTQGFDLPKYTDGDFNGNTYKVSCHFKGDTKQVISSYGVARRKKEARKKAAQFMLKRLNLR